MSLTVESTSFPSGHYPCYNNPGKLTMESTDAANLVPNGLNEQLVAAIGSVQEFVENGFLLQDEEPSLIFATVVDMDFLNVWPGDYVEIFNTENYDGRYLVLNRLQGGLLLDGVGGELESLNPQFLNKRVKFSPQLKLECTIRIEDDHEIDLLIPPSNDGLFRLSTADFLKDYFKFRFAVGNLGGGFFQKYVGQIRFTVEFTETFRKFNPVLNNGITTYVSETVTGTPSESESLYCFNAALDYYDAANSNADILISETDYYSKYLIVTGSSATTNRFCTYRPQTTYIQRDEPAFVSILRADFATDDYRLFLKAYNSSDTEVWAASYQWSDTPNTYVDGHAITWNAGQIANNIISPVPATAVYYEAYAAIGTTQATRAIRFNLVDKCGDRYTLIWKNEFGFPEAFTFYAPASDYTNTDFDSLEIDKYVGNDYQPGNTAKYRASAPRSIQLNTGLINGEHARWLLGIGRSTEVFLIDWQNLNPGVQGIVSPTLFESAVPVIVEGQRIGTVNSKRNIHNMAIDCTYAYNRSQVGNRMVV